MSKEMDERQASLELHRPKAQQIAAGVGAPQQQQQSLQMLAEWVDKLPNYAAPPIAHYPIASMGNIHPSILLQVKDQIVLVPVLFP